MTFRRLIILGLNGCICLLGCNGASTNLVGPVSSNSPATRETVEDSDPSNPRSPEQQIEVVLGTDGLAILRQPRAAELLILAETWPNPPAETAPGDRIGGRLIVGRKQITEPEQLWGIARLLRDEKSYDFGDPGYYVNSSGTVAIRFQGAGGHELQILFDPTRHTVGRMEHNAGPQAAAARRNMEDFGLLLMPGRAEFVRLLKAAWPNRSEVLALSESLEEYRKRFPPAVLAVLQAPDSIECFRIESMADWRRRLKMTAWSGYYASRVPSRLMGFDMNWIPEEERAPIPKLQPAEVVAGDVVTRRGPKSDVRLARDMAEALLDDQTYVWHLGKPMCFRPGVAYRFRKSDRAVVASICFDCHNLQWTFEGFSPEELPRERLGMQVLSERGLGRLKWLAARAFPGDPAFGFPEDREIQRIGTDGNK